MINVHNFYSVLIQNNINFFTGVPDSLLKDFCSYVDNNAGHHVIAANEGSAVAMAIGHHLSTQKYGLVYLQNSGLGNAINPLLSLADSDVYGIPMLLMVGWRGEPGVADEPQHKKQGKVMLAMLDAMNIPYAILPFYTDEANETVKAACDHIKKHQEPYVLIVQKGCFEPYETTSIEPQRYELSRGEAVTSIAGAIGMNDIIVSTTGHCSRELYDYRQSRNQGHERDFLTIGGMGHASQIATSMAMNASTYNVFCLDGDGAAIMHLGGMATSGIHGNHRFKHIVINNGVHHSVGGQKTVGHQISLPTIAKASGYKTVCYAETKLELIESIEKLKNEMDGPSFLEVRVNTNVKSDLGRPVTTPQENKQQLMTFLHHAKDPWQQPA